MPEYNRIPVEVPRVETKFRTIKTFLPVPESLDIIEKCEKYEPKSMQGQHPIVWDKAQGYSVFDKWGNKWIDWSSGVLITNIGHSHPKIIDALQEQLNKNLIASYIFFHEKRAELVELLASVAPKELNKVFLLTTGSEATENCIKLARTYGVKNGGKEKHVIVSFTNAFHGRTLGAQMAGGIPALKDWIINLDPGFVQVPFPDGYNESNMDFNLFLETLEKNNVKPENVAGVITESFQGGGPFFLPNEYAKQLEKFCRDHNAVLIFDEVQAGFGRTGKWFAFEHYNVTPDLIACGKGISSSLPLAAVIGRSEIMDIYQPGSMTSTHSGSPLPVASALANLKVLRDEKVFENVERLSPVLKSSLEVIKADFPGKIGFIETRGLVAGIHILNSDDGKPDAEAANKINKKCFQKGLLMFAPVGTGGNCIKICPPLVIDQEALLEGIEVLKESCREVLEEVCV